MTIQQCRVRDRLIRRGRLWFEKKGLEANGWSANGRTVVEAAYALGFWEGRREAWIDAVSCELSLTDDPDAVKALYWEMDADLVDDLERIEAENKELGDILRDAIYEDDDEDNRPVVLDESSQFLTVCSEREPGAAGDSPLDVEEVDHV